jgi:hypothetical protein
VESGVVNYIYVICSRGKWCCQLYLCYMFSWKVVLSAIFMLYALVESGVVSYIYAICSRGKWCCQLYLCYMFSRKVVLSAIFMLYVLEESGVVSYIYVICSQGVLCQLWQLLYTCIDNNHQLIMILLRRDSYRSKYKSVTFCFSFFRVFFVYQNELLHGIYTNNPHQNCWRP